MKPHRLINSIILALLLMLLATGGVSMSFATPLGGLGIGSGLQPINGSQARPDMPDAPAWHNLYPTFNGIKMVSATDGWIVGSSGTIKRYAGGVWVNAISPTLNQLRAVDGNSSESWAVGDHNTILHWSNNSWQVFTGTPYSDISLYSVSLIAPGEIKVLGIFAGDGGDIIKLLHYQAGQWYLDQTWIELASPPDLAGVSVAMSWISPTDGWLAGYSFYSGSGYDTSTDIFSQTGNLAPPPPGNPPTRTLTAVFKLTTNEGWLGANGTPDLMHYTNGAWQILPDSCTGRRPAIQSLLSFATNDFYALETCGINSNFIHNQMVVSSTDQLVAMSGVTGNDIWVISSTSIYHWDGSNLTNTYAGLRAPAGDPRAVQMFDPNEGWMLSGTGLTSRAMYHYTATHWVQDTTAPSDAINFAFANPTDGWASTPRGFSHYDGTRWGDPLPNQGGYDFSAVQMISATEGWAAGVGFANSRQNAAVAHFSAGSWQPYTLTTVDSVLNSMSFDQANDGWAVGISVTTPIIYHYTNNAWQLTTTPVITSYTFSSVSALAPNNVWIGCVYQRGGSGGCLMHWDGTNWTVFDTPISVAQIQMISPNEGWAVGVDYTSPSGEGGILHYQNGAWHTSSTDLAPQSLNFDSPTDGWAVGAGGLLHYYSQCNDFYTDAPLGYYAYNAIIYLSCQSIVNGTAAHVFSPNAPATRIEFAKMISLARGWQLLTPSSGQTFSDVPPSNPLYSYVEAAYANGAISGASSFDCAGQGLAFPCFLPNDSITRAQTAVITARAFNWPIDSSGGPHFSDVASDNYAYGAVETCYHHGVVTGIGGGLFAPNANVTRAQLAVMLYKALTLP